MGSRGVGARTDRDLVLTRVRLRRCTGRFELSTVASDDPYEPNAKRSLQFASSGFSSVAVARIPAGIRRTLRGPHEGHEGHEGHKGTCTTRFPFVSLVSFVPFV